MIWNLDELRANYWNKIWYILHPNNSGYDNIPKTLSTFMWKSWSVLLRLRVLYSRQIELRPLKLSCVSILHWLRSTWVSHGNYILALVKGKIEFPLHNTPCHGFHLIHWSISECQTTGDGGSDPFTWYFWSFTILLRIISVAQFLYDFLIEFHFRVAIETPLSVHNIYHWGCNEILHIPSSLLPSHSSCILKCKHMTLAISMLNNIFPCTLQRKTIISSIPMCYAKRHKEIKLSI